MRDVWLIENRPGTDIPDEDLFPPERIRREQVRTLRAAIRTESPVPVILLPSPRGGVDRGYRPRTEQGRDGETAESVRTVMPIVLDRLPPHNFMPVVLPESLRDPMGNFMLHVGGRQLLFFFFAMLFTGAGLFAAGFFLHRSTMQEQAQMPAAPRTVAATPEPAKPRKQPTEQESTAAQPTAAATAASGSDRTGRRARTPGPGAVAGAPSASNGGERRANRSRTPTPLPGGTARDRSVPGGAVRVQVGDIPVFVK